MHHWNSHFLMILDIPKQKSLASRKLSIKKCKKNIIWNKGLHFDSGLVSWFTISPRSILHLFAVSLGVADFFSVWLFLLTEKGPVVSKLCFSLQFKWWHQLALPQYPPILNVLHLCSAFCCESSFFNLSSSGNHNLELYAAGGSKVWDKMSGKMRNDYQISLSNNRIWKQQIKTEK